MRALALIVVLLAGCASEPPGALVVPLEEKNAERLSSYGMIDVLQDVPSPDAARIATAAVRILVARGYGATTVAAEPSFLLQPVVVVDGARARKDGQGPLSGRVALFLPGIRGPVFSRVFFLEDPDTLDEALAAILGNLPGPRR